MPADEVMAVVEQEQAIPYDVKDVELGHVDGRCSFESIILKYALSDPGLQVLAKVVHDVASDIDIVPEAAGLKAIAHGFALVHGEDDQEKIRAGDSPLRRALCLGASSRRRQRADRVSRGRRAWWLAD